MRVQYAVLFILLAALVGSGCGKRRIVGETLGKSITAEAFRARYEDYLSQSGERDNILVREKILNNMLNEILIVDDIHRQKFDADSTYVQTMHDFTQQALLDTYAKRMASDTLTVTERELEEEFRALHTRVNARYVYAPTLEGARKLKSRLERGETFEAVAREVFLDQTLSTSGGSLGFFGYGDMEYPLQETAFRLAPGELSDPVKLRVGYAIVRVDKRVQTPLQSEIDFAKAKPRLEKAVRERKMMAIFRREADAIEADLHPQFNEQAIHAALACWASATTAGSMAEELPQIPDSIAGLPLLKFRDGDWSVRDVLLRAERMRSRDRGKVQTADDMKAVAIGLATRDVMLENARREGVERDERVGRQVDKVREEYLLHRWRNSVIDSITARSIWNDDSLRATFERNKAAFHVPPMINVREILVATRQSAENIAARLRSGEDFADLARRYSIRQWSALRGGELGYASRDMFGNLGGKLFDARIGAIIGPEFIEPYYGVFAVIDRKPGRPKTFEESRDEVIASLLPARREAALRDALDAIRNRAGILINMQELANVAVSSE